MISKAWYSHGKLLITGEYLILDGAKALALPLKLGQYLTFKKAKEPLLKWTALKPDGAWFQAQFSLPGLDVIKTTEPDLSDHLRKILLQVRSLNNNFLLEQQGVEAETILEFDPDYGFGSSSTLINNLARWADVDPYKLQNISFGGSGYDIACAQAEHPITFQLINSHPTVNTVQFNPPFKDQLYFVYLNKKQQSRSSIVAYRKEAQIGRNDIQTISDITDKLTYTQDLANFELLLFEHEKIISTVLGKPTIQSALFEDHPGIVKSLGAWGGDFVMMTNHIEPADFKAYLSRKGYETWFRFDEIVKS